VGPAPTAGSLDPLERLLLQQMPRAQPPMVGTALVEQVAHQLLRRCWVQADGRSGRVRLELDGAHEGSVVELVFDGHSGQLHVDVELPDGAAPHTRHLMQGLGSRLREKGLPVAGFNVSGPAESPAAPSNRPRL
jgi:hypothetical protein